MTDPTGATGYGYDFRDRLIEKATPFGTLFYGWDDAGNLAGMQSSNTNGAWVTYSWDAANRLESLTDNRLGETTLYAYDAVGASESMTSGNALETNMTRDLLNRVTRQEIANATPPAAFDYTLDDTGRRTSVTELGGRLIDYSQR